MVYSCPWRQETIALHLLYFTFPCLLTYGLWNLEPTKLDHKPQSFSSLPSPSVWVACSHQQAFYTGSIGWNSSLHISPGSTFFRLRHTCPCVNLATFKMSSYWMFQFNCYAPQWDVVLTLLVRHLRF